MGRRSYLDLDEINSEDELGSIASELKTCSFEGSECEEAAQGDCLQLPSTTITTSFQRTLREQDAGSWLQADMPTEVPMLRMGAEVELVSSQESDDADDDPVENWNLFGILGEQKMEEHGGEEEEEEGQEGQQTGDLNGDEGGNEVAEESSHLFVSTAHAAQNCGESGADQVSNVLQGSSESGDSSACEESSEDPDSSEYEQSAQGNPISQPQHWRQHARVEYPGGQRGFYWCARAAGTAHNTCCCYWPCAPAPPSGSTERDSATAACIDCLLAKMRLHKIQAQAQQAPFGSSLQSSQQGEGVSAASQHAHTQTVPDALSIGSCMPSLEYSYDQPDLVEEDCMSLLLPWEVPLDAWHGTDAPSTSLQHQHWWHQGGHEHEHQGQSQPTEDSTAATAAGAAGDAHLSSRWPPHHLPTVQLSMPQSSPSILTWPPVLPQGTGLHPVSESVNVSDESSVDWEKGEESNSEQGSSGAASREAEGSSEYESSSGESTEEESKMSEDGDRLAGDSLLPVTGLSSSARLTSLIPDAGGNAAAQIASPLLPYNATQGRSLAVTHPASFANQGVADVPAEPSWQQATASSTGDEGEESACWICLGTLAPEDASSASAPSPASTLISPCTSCRGGIGLVHMGCLQKWISSSFSYTCANCHSPYAREVLEAFPEGRTMLQLLPRNGDISSWQELHPLGTEAVVTVTGGRQFTVPLDIMSLPAVLRSIQRSVEFLSAQQSREHPETEGADMDGMVNGTGHSTPDPALPETLQVDSIELQRRQFWREDGWELDEFWEEDDDDEEDAEISLSSYLGREPSFSSLRRNSTQPQAPGADSSTLSPTAAQRLWDRPLPELSSAGYAAQGADSRDSQTRHARAAGGSFQLTEPRQMRLAPSLDLLTMVIRENSGRQHSRNGAGDSSEARARIDLDEQRRAASSLGQGGGGSRGRWEHMEGLPARGRWDPLGVGRPGRRPWEELGEDMPAAMQGAGWEADDAAERGRMRENVALDTHAAQAAASRLSEMREARRQQQANQQLRQASQSTHSRRAQRNSAGGFQGGRRR